MTRSPTTAARWRSGPTTSRRCTTGASYWPSATGTSRRARALDEALAIDPEAKRVLGDAAHARAHLCDWRDYDRTVERLRQGVLDGKPVTVPFPLLNLSEDPALQLAGTKAFVDDAYPPAAHPLWNGERYEHDRIRVAYLSANFHDHPVAYLIAELFERHDRQRFEITGISFGPDRGAEMRARLVAGMDRFVDVCGKGDAEAAQLMRDLEIDIAVDLMGFTMDARPGILAHRPAPIQANYLGYPGTMGAPYVDYIIADRFLIPSADEVHYAEKVVALPDSYQANDTRRPIAERTPTRAEAGLPETGFVFCCFNNNYKIIAARVRRLDAAAPARRRIRALAARLRPRGRTESALRSVGARRRPGPAGVRAEDIAREPSGAPPAGRPLRRHAAVQRAHHGQRRAVGGTAAGDLRGQDLRQPRGREPAARRRAARARHREPRRIRGSGAGAGDRSGPACATCANGWRGIARPPRCSTSTASGGTSNRPTSRWSTVTGAANGRRASRSSR